MLFVTYGRLLNMDIFAWRENPRNVSDGLQ